MRTINYNFGDIFLKYVYLILEIHFQKAKGCTSLRERVLGRGEGKTNLRRQYEKWPNISLFIARVLCAFYIFNLFYEKMGCYNISCVLLKLHTDLLLFFNLQKKFLTFAFLLQRHSQISHKAHLSHIQYQTPPLT